MRVLSIETATSHGSVAIVGPEGVLAERSAYVQGEHLEWLMEAIAATLDAARLSREAIDGLVVSIGPGGFMGLRVGLMTASSWAIAADRPVAGVSTLEVIAAGAAAEAGAPARRGVVLAAIDARRGEIAAALFDCGASTAGGPPARLTPDLVVAPSAIRDHLPPVTGHVIVAGDALERHQAAITGALAPWAVPLERDRWWPRARVGGALGRARLLRGERDDPLGLVPRYARAPV